jgi:hypothetical protein
MLQLRHVHLHDLAACLGLIHPVLQGHPAELMVTRATCCNVMAPIRGLYTSASRIVMSRHLGSATRPPNPGLRERIGTN